MQNAKPPTPPPLKTPFRDAELRIANQNLPKPIISKFGWAINYLHPDTTL